jgi:hypothetical protein
MFIALLGDSILPNACPLDPTFLGQGYANLYGTENLQMNYDKIFEMIWNIKSWGCDFTYNSSGVLNFSTTEEVFTQNMPQTPQDIINCNFQSFSIDALAVVTWETIINDIIVQDSSKINFNINFAQILQWAGIGNEIISGSFSPFYFNLSGFSPSLVTRSNFNYTATAPRITVNLYPTEYFDYS